MGANRCRRSVMTCSRRRRPRATSSCRRMAVSSPIRGSRREATSGLSEGPRRINRRERKGGAVVPIAEKKKKTYVVKKKLVVDSIGVMLAELEAVARLVKNLPGTGFVVTLRPRPLLPDPWVGRPCGGERAIGAEATAKSPVSRNA